MDITIDKKTDQDITFQYYEADSLTTRTLVGATVFFTVKANPYDTDPSDSLAKMKKIVSTHTTPSTGLTTITLTSTDTDVPPLSYFYDIKVKEADGKIYNAQEGKCVIDGSPTNSTP
jgi:hypothetical protein